MTRIAIVGGGHIGEVHADAIQQVKNCSIVSVSEVVEEKGKAFSDKYNCNYYKDLDEMLKREDFDVAAICTPTFLHAEMVEKAALAKKHIFCEKPLAMNLDEADRMVSAVKKSGVKAMTGHVLRFWPAYSKVKEIIESGEMGRPLHGYCERLMTIPPWTEGGWNKNEELSGGAALDIQIHDADYILWLFGSPKTVKSQGVFHSNWGGWMHIGTNIGFDGGQSALIQVGWGFPVDFPFTNVIRIVCEEGTIEWMFRIGMDSWNETEEGYIQLYKIDGSSRKEFVDQTDPFMLEWKYFIECLEKGNAIDNSSIEDGRKSLELVLAAIQSAKEGSVVTL